MAHPALTTILRKVNHDIDHGALTVSKVAEKTGYSKPSVYGWLRQDRDPSFAAAASLASLVGLKIAVVE
jgi:DNA-binding phage protein